MDTEVSRTGMLGMRPMPMAGSVGAPFFGGKYVTEFLARFEDLWLDYGVTPSTEGSACGEILLVEHRTLPSHDTCIQRFRLGGAEACDAVGVKIRRRRTEDAPPGIPRGPEVQTSEMIPTT